MPSPSSHPPPLPDEERPTARMSITDEAGGTVVPLNEDRAGRGVRIAIEARRQISRIWTIVARLVARRDAEDARAAWWGGHAGRVVWLVIGVVVVAATGWGVAWLGGWHR